MYLNWLQHYQQVNFDNADAVSAERRITQQITAEYRERLESAIQCGDKDAASRHAWKLANLSGALEALDDIRRHCEYCNSTEHSTECCPDNADAYPENDNPAPYQG